MPSIAMLDVRRDFDVRTTEIKNYLNFASEIDGGIITLNYSGTSSLTPANAVSWSKTIRASCFLLIYNLAESTVKNAIAAIFDDLQSKAISFDSCKVGVRKIILNNFKAMSPDRALSELLQIALDVAVKSFNKDRIFPGNLDSKKVRELANAYGFANPSGKGYHLREIKNHRNDLAHGDKSFDEIGRDYTIGEIVTIFGDVEDYLKSALNNIENYIDNQVYLI